MYYMIAPTNSDLQHHGILGMHWGRRNGPPYPLDGSSHSASEKKAGWRKSLSNKGNESSNKTYDPKSKSGKVNLPIFISINPAFLAYDVVAITINKASDIIEKHSANVREQKMDKNRLKLEKDDKTGLPLKKKETKSKEDLKHVNPGFRNGDDDTKNNCPFCCMAYDLRRRGYDVRAGKTEKGRTLDEISKFYKENKKFTVVKVEGKDKEHNPTLKDKSNKMRSTLLEKSGEGTRGTIGISWMLGGNHVMNYEVKDGKVHIYDAQSGQERNITQLNTRIRNGFSYLRTDNLTPDYKKMKKEGAIIG